KGFTVVTGDKLKDSVKDGVAVRPKSGETATVRWRDSGDGEVELWKHERERGGEWSCEEDEKHCFMKF
ncbi:hypothetical protein A2U01_0065249, partial [Trifolium medium]|nr:hypothetical protein [Trifolium medium]